MRTNSAERVASGADCAKADTLRWQASAFVTPLDFPLRSVSAVCFPTLAQRPKPSGQYCFELEGGDMLFGALAGLFAALGALALGTVVSRQVFQLNLDTSPWLPVAGMLGGALFAVMVGWLGFRRLLATPPLLALRNGA